MKTFFLMRWCRLTLHGVVVVFTLKTDCSTRKSFGSIPLMNIFIFFVLGYFLLEVLSRDHIYVKTPRPGLMQVWDKTIIPLDVKKSFD